MIDASGPKKTKPSVSGIASTTRKWRICKLEDHLASLLLCGTYWHDQMDWHGRAFVAKDNTDSSTRMHWPSVHLSYDPISLDFDGYHLISP